MDETGSPEELERELEAVRAERDALRTTVEKADRRRASRGRSIAIVLLIVLSVLSLAAAVPGNWGRRTFLNTDRYVATVAPLASDPAIQEVLARDITNAVFQALDVQDRVAGALQDRVPELSFIAAPITSALEDFVQARVLAIVSSELFQQYWTEANRFIHEQAMATLQGGGDTVSVVNGKIVLNYLPLVNEALNQVAATAGDLIGKRFNLPEITPDTVPVEAIAAIEAQTGLDLPDTFGTVVVYDSSQLAIAQDAVQLFNRGVYLLIFLFLVTAAVALWISPRRRRTLLQLFVTYAVVLVVERRLAIAGGNQIVEAVKPENMAASRAVVDALLGSLLGYTAWLLWISVAVIAIALATGPYAWAVRLRGGAVDLGRGIVGTAQETSTSGVMAWVAAHRDVVMFATAGIGVVLLLLLDLSLFWGVVLILLVGAVELLAWRAASEADAGST
jgi:hypothetical protein